ncbi:MAG: hypothetical protein WStaPseu_13480 [Shewanella algae]
MSHGIAGDTFYPWVPLSNKEAPGHAGAREDGYLNGIEICVTVPVFAANQPKTICIRAG